MLKLKVLGAAAVLAIAPLLTATSADAQFANRGPGPRATITPGGQAVYVNPGIAGRPVVSPYSGRAAGWTGPGPSVARPGGWVGRPGVVGPRPGWNGGYRRGYGPGIGFATGLAAGAALAGSSYYYGPGYYSSPGYVVEDYDDEPVVAVPSAGGDSDDAYCRQRYRSYDPRSRTYLNNDGNRYPCP